MKKPIKKTKKPRAKWSRLKNKGTAFTFNGGSTEVKKTEFTHVFTMRKCLNPKEHDSTNSGDYCTACNTKPTPTIL